LNVIVVIRLQNGTQSSIENIYDSWDTAYIDHPDCIANFTTEGITLSKTEITARVWRDHGDAMVGCVLPVITLDDVRDHVWNKRD
jgi:hypothetical protein